MCVLDNTAQGLGQVKKQVHPEDDWHGAWSMEKEARREVGRDERSGIICRKEIFDRKPYIVPNRVMVKCELRESTLLLRLRRVYIAHQYMLLILPLYAALKRCVVFPSGCGL